MTRWGFVSVMPVFIAVLNPRVLMAEKITKNSDDNRIGYATVQNIPCTVEIIEIAVYFNSRKKFISPAAPFP